MTFSSLFDDLGPPPDVPLADDGIPDSPQTAESARRRYGNLLRSKETGGAAAPGATPGRDHRRHDQRGLYASSPNPVGSCSAQGCSTSQQQRNADLGNLGCVLDAMHYDPGSAGCGAGVPHQQHLLRTSMVAFPRDSATFEVHQLRQYVTERDTVIAQLENLLKEQSSRYY